MGERSNTYLTHDCRLPQIVDNLEGKDIIPDLSANTVVFIRCRSRVTLMVVIDIRRGRRAVGIARSRVWLMDVNIVRDCLD
jgi:hypothetical protein